MFRRRLRIIVATAIILIAALLVLAPDWPAFGDQQFQLDEIVRQDRRFDFLLWQVGALSAKLDGFLDDSSGYMPPGQQSSFVLAYLDLIRKAQEQQGQIDQIYTDPAVADPKAEAAPPQAELDATRADIQRRQTLAEAIVQNQVSAVLREEGLDIAGWTFPPVLMHMSPLPNMLIVSPRDRIAQVAYASLIPDLSTEDKDGMEEGVRDRLDLSGLVVPIGGLGMYPAMVMETADVAWLARVTSHEWTHHYLAFRPLGVRYLASPEMRTINETVAAIVERDVGPRVIERFYPDKVPSEGTSAAPKPAHPIYGPPYPIPFDFSREMGKTRVEVDRLLAEGKVDEAESYMEARRELFVSHGYPIRKLNQAYFAFYGGYAAEPGGASAGDPIGPMLREIRAASPSLKAFLDQVGTIRGYDDLLRIYRDVTGNDPAAVVAK